MTSQTSSVALTVNGQTQALRVDPTWPCSLFSATTSCSTAREFGCGLAQCRTRTCWRTGCGVHERMFAAIQRDAKPV